MHCRKITLEDGRYLIFYTFDDVPSTVAAAERKRREAEPQSEAVEERRV